MDNQIIPQSEWLNRRLMLLREEKELTALRDRVTEHRRQIGRTLVEKDYLFETTKGPQTLGDLFAGRSQMIVYHFMFHPDWQEGCKSCSLVAESYDRLIVHLNARDVSMITVSRAPLDKLLAFRARMGWSFQWVSSLDNDFNRDFNVTFTEEEVRSGRTNYNFESKPFPVTEAPGISVFTKDDAGQIFRTYASYARGLETFMGVYPLLDIVPKGRDEGADGYAMQWVRHRDGYGGIDPSAEMVAHAQHNAASQI